MKKIILLPFISLMVLQLVAQTKTVTIHGIVTDTTVKSIKITHVVDDKLSKWENKKLNVENGAFNTSIQIPFPAQISIAYGNKLYTNIFIYNDAEILIDFVGEPHIIGSPLQDEYEDEFLSFFQSNNKVYDSVNSFYVRNYQKYGDDDLPKLVLDSAALLKEKYYLQRAELLREYIRLHPNSYVALWDINYFASSRTAHQYFDFEKLFSSFSKQMRQQPLLNVIKEKITELHIIQVGEIFPKDFFKGYEQMQSKVKKNSQYYLIDFWHSHCGPCVASFPKLKEIYTQFHDKGFDIVSISVDRQEDQNDYVSAIQKNKLVWNHVWDKDGATANKFNINFFPTYILLDKNDRIINYNIQGNQLEAFLKENL